MLKRKRNLDRRSVILIWMMRNSAFWATWEKYEIMLKLPIFLHVLQDPGNLKSLYFKITAQTNKWALGFGKIHSFCHRIRFFGGCKSFDYFARNQEKTPKWICSYTSQVANSMLNVTAWPLTIIRLNVVFHRVLTWALSLFFEILMTSIFHQVYLSLYYLLMTLTTFSLMLKIFN